MIEREDIWLILCGRCAVPPWLTEVRYREVFYVIQESDLVFDDRMAEQFAKQQALYLTEEQLELGKAYCRGVPIAWTMCAEIYRRLTEELPVAKRREPLPEELYRKFVDITYQQMWDYLEGACLRLLGYQHPGIPHGGVDCRQLRCAACRDDHRQE